MNNYTKIIPDDLWDKLQSKGMHKIEVQDSIWGLVTMQPTYADVFDWLLNKGINIRIESDWDTETQIVTKLACGFHIEKIGIRPIYIDCPTWQEAANTTIEKALTLI